MSEHDDGKYELAVGGKLGLDIIAIRLCDDDVLTENEIIRRVNEYDRHESALREIADWARAYPLEAFPKPDLEKAHKVLKENGMTLDAISAHVARHVVERVGKIAQEALEANQ